jgi:two-component system NtrC family sensor kinase
MQAMPDGGLLSVRADMESEDYIRLDLSDTGTGIKPSDIEHIFDPFFSTKEAQSGTGLGLSLVYKTIRTHGGYIEVKSEINKGTTFSIYLPVVKDKEKDFLGGEPPGSNH